MKKLIFMLAVLVIASGSVFAIDLLQYPPSVEGGDFIIDIGAGVSLGYGLNDAGMRIPPVFATVEYALPVKVPISVGGIFSFWQYNWDGDSYPYMNIAALGNWHWAFNVKWLDLYTGFSLGYLYSRNSYLPLSFGTQAGAHFYFTKNVGVMGEFGYPIFAKAGLALKF